MTVIFPLPPIRHMVEICPKLVMILMAWTCAGNLSAQTLPTTIKAVKPSIVAIATYKVLRSPAVTFFGTGFVVGDGLTIITNVHVVRGALKPGQDDTLGVLTGKGEAEDFRVATIAAMDEEHDLAMLKITGTPLPALTLGDASMATEGQAIAFTGFPLGSLLGFHPATHQGIISAITPVTMPTLNSRTLNANVIMQLRRAPFNILQLDATAYPGNSGSPVYSADNGVVLGVINMVFVKGLKETAITDPSGITYAIPIRHVQELLNRKL